MCGVCRDWGQGWLKSERKLSIKIGLFIQEPTYWIKHTIFTRLFVQDILHHHEERTYISIKSFDIQRSSVQKTWLYFTIRSVFILLSEVFHKPAGKVVIKVTHCTTHHQMISPVLIFSGHEVRNFRPFKVNTNHWIVTWKEKRYWWTLE